MRAIVAEFPPTLRLALPVVVAELGWVGMGVVDTMMVGRLGAEAIGAVGLGRALFFPVAIIGIGMLLGLDTLVAIDFGGGRLERCHRSLIHGIYLSLALSIPLMFLLVLMRRLLPQLVLDPPVLRGATDYMRAVSWSLLPLLLYSTLRRYLQAVNCVRVVMFALVSANLINMTGNWLLIYGNAGFPRLGASGAGWSTCISSSYMTIFLLVALIAHERARHGNKAPINWRLETSRMWQLLRLGTPAAGQLTLEIAVFALATVLVARIDAVSLAAHQIVLTTASVTFMVPVGISAAGAIRVGHALGRRDVEGVARAGWAVLLIGSAFMSVASILFIVIPLPLAMLYSTDPAVLRLSVTLLAIAAAFQLFDGVQVIATGILRGLGNTHTPMLWNLFGHWLIGLPVSYLLCFTFGMGAAGLWIGLSTGLIVIGIGLMFVWRAKLTALRSAEAGAGM